jgi:hypothetical protein
MRCSLPRLVRVVLAGAALQGGCGLPDIGGGRPTCGPGQACAPAQPCAPGDTTCAVDATSDAGPAADAGGIYAGGPDAGGEVGALSCAARFPGALRCDDFESGQLTGWGLHVEGAELAPTTARSRSGTHAVRGRVATAGQTGVAMLVHDLGGGVTSGELFLRAHFFLADPLAVSEWLILLELGTPAGVPYEKISADILAGDRHNLVSTLPEPHSGNTSAPATVKAGVWQCVGLHVVIAAAGGAGRAALTIDGQVVAQTAQGVATLPPGGIGTARFGLYAASGNVRPAEVFWDDVVVSRAPLPCD